MNNKSGLTEYWTRVAAGLCTECGIEKVDTGTLKRPVRRCADCLKRVAEYNANRRGKPEGANRATYRQMQKGGSRILGIIEDLRNG